ncbi:hypothetical protein AURDEDRAFT_149844 [Auricularia subglabra TFB-10046 SS5]|nr:hypothetical protein AURDEDRAFT_149844 [Auricularia subglabra TFB-10046 SS5]
MMIHLQSLLALALLACTASAAQTVTVTKTLVTTSTVTAPGSCPTSCPDSSFTTDTITFEPELLGCPSICPFPLEFLGFTFDGNAGWLLVHKDNATDPRAVWSPPLGLMTQSSGFVGFGSLHRFFVFDVLSFYFAVFSNDANKDVVFFMNGLTSDGAPRNYSFTTEAGIHGVGPYMLDLTTPQSVGLNFNSLVHIEFAAYTSYDPKTKTGMPATIVFDNFKFRRHFDPCNN